ncbi:sensor histidine kinase [Cyanobium sp. WAJ14-Wanaka]|uniref:sensor histidine kinase n=1 Tax=Cyanobium sp. WAJ14-Wanaka TaxID=2823725 RepID=UPI0020CDD303|nr:sensor histidine kinase [Cyanobium sp. WAJ14-Wanaka]MCP9776005.1 sensor histidine kinase [Cyanobium sp. WAJ14-Wanaka]
MVNPNGSNPSKVNTELSLAALRRSLADGVPAGTGDEDSVRRQWWAALATLQDDLLQQEGLQGVWLAAPLPALYEPGLLQQLQGWVWAPSELEDLLPAASSLLPIGRGPATGMPSGGGFQRLPLGDDDGTDPLLLVITPKVQVALCLDGPAKARRLVVRFDPQVLSSALGLINRRLQASDPAAAEILRSNLQKLGSLQSDEQLVLRFWPRLAERLAAIAPSVTLQPLVHGGGDPGKAASSELALLEALTHEVRTPLATIRTLIRSLLKRGDMPPIVRQRLEQIDGECSEQIDRFGLIFLAAELQRQPSSEVPLGPDALARTDLSALLGQLEEIWQKQLARRDLQLELEIAVDLPPVLSDPTRLETMLGGLIDRFSRSLPSGSTVKVALQPAGAKLKLHLSSTDSPSGGKPPGGSPTSGTSRELVGPVLSWNPATGSLQLSRQATQRLFERLGGRLTERSGNGLTVFFPIC